MFNQIANQGRKILKRWLLAFVMIAVISPFLGGWMKVAPLVFIVIIFFSMYLSGFGLLHFCDKCNSRFSRFIEIEREESDSFPDPNVVTYHVHGDRCCIMCGEVIHEEFDETIEIQSLSRIDAFGNF